MLNDNFTASLSDKARPLECVFPRTGDKLKGRLSKREQNHNKRFHMGLDNVKWFDENDVKHMLTVTSSQSN